MTVEVSGLAIGITAPVSPAGDQDESDALRLANDGWRPGPGGWVPSPPSRARSLRAGKSPARCGGRPRCPPTHNPPGTRRSPGERARLNTCSHRGAMAWHYRGGWLGRSPSTGWGTATRNGPGRRAGQCRRRLRQELPATGYAWAATVSGTVRLAARNIRDSSWAFVGTLRGVLVEALHDHSTAAGTSVLGSFPWWRRVRRDVPRAAQTDPAGGTESCQSAVIKKDSDRG